MHDEPVRPVPDDEHAQIAADRFRMLSDPTRVKILWALFQGESNVNTLAENVGATPASVSQHLAKLRLAGLVRTRREGTFVYYSATDTHVHRLLAESLSHAEHVTGVAAGADAHSYRAAGPVGR
ncbi:transcriptional regulator, ArsR family [Georgenia satyanarayanai]|uniref:Transcriptional regulator, ArsR family n=1 Tax=Georgenia satyanarayanai TaxID=860221 RepID=A0A2Y9AGP3_9MICO|nr:metalloregulator ArsR/SmtB family transcription factor [Georgenia satyanarayanai]PYF99197.1 ArsR family transcriptional regulator [Georgenia satyanarayanai]SSA43315.1 transcriptional regulator, ArsR family [Georgenia satyanarayanai]